jgi:hypothetical protein
MKHLNGKKIKISDNAGNVFEGICTGATDEIIKLLLKNEVDERVFFTKNIFSYVIVGGGITGGYSGLKTYICKNDNINCKGRVKITAKECHINDMGCLIDNNDKAKFKCDFGCIGAIEIIPSKVQKILFEGMNICREQTKNYLEEATNQINKEKNNEQQ